MRPLKFAMAIAASSVLLQLCSAQQAPTDIAVPWTIVGSSYQLVSNSGQGFDFSYGNGYSVTSAFDSTSAIGDLDENGFRHGSLFGSILCNWVVTIQVNGSASAFAGSYVQYTVNEERWTGIDLQSTSAGDAYVKASGGETGSLGTSSIDQYQGGAADGPWQKHDTGPSERRYFDVTLVDMGNGTCRVTFTLPGNTLASQARLTYKPGATTPVCSVFAKSALLWSFSVWKHGSGGPTGPVIP